MIFHQGPNDDRGVPIDMAHASASGCISPETPSAVSIHSFNHLILIIRVSSTLDHRTTLKD
ncbi:hypothetical protein [Veronia pacifica]|uniref:hypothetical protein n=1 Tax=Veronia pacifica TaxID=1080227 RepID=UPI001586E60D|nr:hypothetical protein [Veronia pacifica]